MNKQQTYYEKHRKHCLKYASEQIKCNVCNRILNRTSIYRHVYTQDCLYYGLDFNINKKSYKMIVKKHKIKGDVENIVITFD